MPVDDHPYANVAEELNKAIPPNETTVATLMRQCGAHSVDELIEQLMLFVHCEDCNKPDCTILDCAPMQEVRRHSCGYDYMDDDCECTVLAFLDYPCFYYYASIANHFDDEECDEYPCPLCDQLSELISQMKDPLIDSQGWRRTYQTKNRLAMITNVTYAIRLELDDDRLHIFGDIRRHEQTIYRTVKTKEEYLNLMEGLVAIYPTLRRMQPGGR